MKKVFVSNGLSWTSDVSCCNLYKRVNWFKCLLSSKQANERKLSDKFNEISSQGFVFMDEKVLPHKLYDENFYVGHTYHGVFRFTEGHPAKYQVYFGPVIEILPEKVGCKLGCKPGKLGCKSGGGFSCKNGIGCRSKGGATQYVNFLNDEKNQPVVQKLNSHFSLRKLFKKEDDYVYSTVSQESVNEIVKERYDEIREKYNQDVQRFYNEGLGYIKTMDTPEDLTSLLTNEIFDQAMLFGSTTRRKALMADLSDFSTNVTLSRFDVWYFPVVKGLIRRILEIIPWFRKKADYVATPFINDQNLEYVESVYEADFNEQEGSEIINKVVSESIIGKIPVTFAIKRKIGFWGRLFRDVEYDFQTYMIDAIEG